MTNIGPPRPIMPRQYLWTDERAEMLLGFQLEGLSASKIAGRMPPDEYETVPSRNSIIGKLQRMGITSRTSVVRAPKPERPKAERKPKHIPEPVAWVRGLKSQPPILSHKLPPEPEVSLEPLRVTLMELAHDGCKWPLGNPRDESFRYCGLASEPARPYCAAHWRISRIPSREQKRIRQKWLTERGLWKVEASA